MLRSVRYAATPHQEPRRHKIPIDAIEALTDVRDQVALDRTDCLARITIVTRADGPTDLPPVVVRPASGGEIFLGKRLVTEYPQRFGPQDFLLVDLTVIR